MSENSWHRRLSRRRFLKVAASAVALGGAASLWPGRPTARAAGGSRISGVLAEDIVHGPRELARGEIRGAAASALRAAALEPFSPGAVYTSPVVRTSFPFTHVGLHWRAGNPAASEAQFEAHTSVDGRGWSPWWPVEIEAEAGQAARGETYGSLITEDHGRFFQYRASFRDEEAAAFPMEYVVVTALHAAAATNDGHLRSSAVQHSADSAALPFTKDQFLRREDWGADENLRFHSTGAEIYPRMYVPVKKLIVHHTATLGNLDPEEPSYPNPNYNREQAEADVRAIYYYHTVTLGWGDIGYNALIDRFGRVFEGRYGRDEGPRREVLSPGVVASHVAYFNQGADGVAVIGNFDINELGATERANMVPALLDYLAWDAGRHAISPTGSSDFLRVDMEWRPGLPNIPGHRDCGRTACPGQHIYKQLPGWRRGLLQRFPAEQAALQVDLAGPDGVTIPGKLASFRWEAGTAQEFSYYLEGWKTGESLRDIFYLEGFTQDKRPDWSPYGDVTVASFGSLEEGRYTFHVRAKDALGQESAFEANRTFIVGSGSGYTIGVPGLARS
jgi:hypothetical protein